MSERKVLSKYYPADFDPATLTRKRKHEGEKAGPKVQVVRLMAPFSMRCTACGEFIYKGRKFNARKETPEGKRYLGIQIFRFYIRCTRCSAEIVFATDPKNQDYEVERGAKRSVAPWKRGLGDGPHDDETDEQRLDRLEREMAEADGEQANERNAMMELEAKTEEAKREMAVADALDEIRSRNSRLERAQREGGAEMEASVAARPQDEERDRQEREDEETARRAFAFARQQEVLWEELDGDTADADSPAGPTSTVAYSSSVPDVPSPVAVVAPVPTTDMLPPPLPVPTFKRQVKKKKDHSALLGIKKKPSLV